MTEPILISSRENALLKELRKLSTDNTAYRKAGRFWIEGDHLLEGLDPLLSEERRTELGRQMVLGEVGTERLLAQPRVEVHPAEPALLVGEFDAHVSPPTGLADFSPILLSVPARRSGFAARPGLVVHTAGWPMNTSVPCQRSFSPTRRAMA